MNQLLDRALRWPRPEELTFPVVMDQQWIDAVFLYGRTPEPVAARFMPWACFMPRAYSRTPPTEPPGRALSASV